MELKNIRYDTHLRIIDVPGDGELFWQLILLAVVVLVLALAATVYFSWRKARRYHLPFWDPSARRLLFHLSVPLAAGGIFAIILILRNDITLLASVVLIFYGLALLNAGKYTLREVQVLGLLEIGMGLLAGIFIHYGLLFWAVGFGVLHIVYGTLMYLKYERKKTSQ
jgi:hypothetical protein